jgi:hypothetical protein
VCSCPDGSGLAKRSAGLGKCLIEALVLDNKPSAIHGTDTL